MSNAPTVLAAAINTTDATSFTTASIAVASHYNELITLAILSKHASTDPNIPTLTTTRGLSLTQTVTTLISADFTRLTLFNTCIASGGTSGTLVIDFAGQTQTICAWDVVAWTGTAATAANNGSDGVAHAAGVGSAANGTTISRSLATPSAGSSTYYACSHAANEATSNSPGFSQLSEAHAGTPATGFQSAWHLAAVTSCDPTWTTNGHPRIIVATEILIAPVGGADTAFVGGIPI